MLRGMPKGGATNEMVRSQASDGVSRGHIHKASQGVGRVKEDSIT